ncbi:MAG: chemotaxis protein [Candidatus Accumulibacter sp. 66-26]|nr:HAMP domain-containing protein [Accumulibacter sp.]OJW52015.1 MAG: chemotaxis protein [Candidatus Accumulibacter sp. 66-26]
MQALFAPAIALMNRLGYTKKFAVMGALALVAIAVLLFNLFNALDQVIRKSETELVGIEAMKPISRLVQATQQHRGLSSGVLNGNEAMRDKRAAKEKEVSDLLKAVEPTIPAALQGGEAWKHIQTEWENLRSDGMNLIVGENFSAHTALVDEILTFQASVADEYSLTNDPDIDSMYLIDTATIKLPIALERLGQLRARGTGILTKKQILQQQQVDMTAQLAELNSAVKALRQNLDKTSRYNPGMKAALDGAAQGMVETTALVSKLIIEDIFIGAFLTEPAEYFAMTTAAIDKGYQQMFDTLFPSLEQLIHRRIDQARQNLHTSIGITVLMLLIVGYFTVGAYYATINSIGELARNARTIATGDLSVKIDLGTRDELKLVADSFNDMADAFRNLIRNVQSGTDQVYEATKRLSESSSQITLSTEQQSEAASSMAAAVEQMTVGIDHISGNAQNANQISHHAGDLSAEGGRVVGTVVREIELIAGVVNSSAAIIGELGQRSEQISAIVNVIKEIADQTNLLALNAAIEAARAGEQGRGFAVVADEVRKLAERTTKSTQEISTMIGAIQSGTQNAVASMNEGVERVNQGVALATQAGESINEIEGSARRVVDTVSEISESLREQSAASTEIAKNVERIAQMAEENSAAVAENAATAVQLERLSESLEAEVRRFKLV